MGNARHAQFLISDGMHSPYAAIYADQAARNAATGLNGFPFTANDLNKKVLQTSDDTEWVLRGISPVTWKSVQQIGGVVFGADHDFQSTPEEAETGSSAWQDRVVLTAPPGLVGTYRIAWRAQVGQTSTSKVVEARLHNKTLDVTIGDEVRSEPKDKDNWMSVGDFDQVTLSGVSETFALQYRQQVGGTAKIRNAKIEFWRIS